MKLPSPFPPDWPALHAAARAARWELGITLERGVVAWPLDADGYRAGPTHRLAALDEARAWVARGCIEERMADEMPDEPPTGLRAPYPYFGFPVLAQLMLDL